MPTQSWVNIGLGNGLLAESTPEPMLTNHQWDIVAFTWEQFHKKWFASQNHASIEA